MTHALTLNQTDTLELLRDRPEGVTAQEIGEWIGVAATSASMIVGSLALRGLCHVVDAEARPHVYRAGPAGEAEALDRYRRAVRLSFGALRPVYKPRAPTPAQLAQALGCSEGQADELLEMLAGDGMYRR